MNQGIMEKLISYWSKFFFTAPILILLFIFCFIIGLRYHRKERERLLFVIYFFLGIILFCSTTPLQISKHAGKRFAAITEILNTLFELAEFIAFYHFFRVCLRSKIFKKITKIFLLILIIAIVVFFIGLNFPKYSVHSINKHSFFLNVIELFFLFIMCLGYFYELFTNIPNKTLYQRPSFFIVTSTFFYSVLIIPFFMLAIDILKISAPMFYILFGCHFFLLIIVLLSISKAFLGKMAITA